MNGPNRMDSRQAPTLSMSLPTSRHTFFGMLNRTNTRNSTSMKQPQPGDIDSPGGAGGWAAKRTMISTLHLLPCPRPRRERDVVRQADDGRDDGRRREGEGEHWPQRRQQAERLVPPPLANP